MISGTAWGGGATYTTFPYKKNSITDLTRGATDQARISEIFLVCLSVDLHSLLTQFHFRIVFFVSVSITLLFLASLPRCF